MNSDKNTLTYHILLKTTDNAVKFVNTINTLDGYFDICMEVISSMQNQCLAF